VRCSDITPLDTIPPRTNPPSTVVGRNPPGHNPSRTEPVAYLKFGKGGPWRARKARAYNGDLRRSSQRGPGQSPWSGGQGSEAPLKLKHFLLLNVQWKPQIRPILAEKDGRKRTFSYKVACKNFHGRAKGEGASHRAPLKYATGQDPPPTGNMCSR